MNWRKALLGDSTKYSFLDRDELEDHRFTYYLVASSYVIVWVLAAIAFLSGLDFRYWFAILAIGHLYVIVLLLMKLNNFAFMAMNTWLKQNKKKL